MLIGLSDNHTDCFCINMFFLIPHWRGSKNVKRMAIVYFSFLSSFAGIRIIFVHFFPTYTDMDKMKSRSGSIKSLLRTFFKKNGDPKTEKTYYTDSAMEMEYKPIEIPKKVSNFRQPSNAVQHWKYNLSKYSYLQSRTCSTAESIIIPLHSPDYDYGAAAAAAVSKKSALDDVKKDEVTSITGIHFILSQLKSSDETIAIV